MLYFELANWGLHGHCLTFQMRTSASQCNSLSEIRDVIIQPLETYPVYVTYSPVSAALNSGKVVIKPYDTAYKFSVRSLPEKQ